MKPRLNYRDFTRFYHGTLIYMLSKTSEGGGRDSFRVARRPLKAYCRCILPRGTYLCRISFPTPLPLVKECISREQTIIIILNKFNRRFREHSAVYSQTDMDSRQTKLNHQFRITPRKELHCSEVIHPSLRVQSEV